MTEVKAKFPEVKYEDVEKVLEANGTKGVVVDVRHAIELEEDGRIDGFINVPLDKVKMAFTMEPLEFELTFHASKPDPKKDVIFSCRSGRRALMAAESLQELETYPHIKVYAGSFQDWVMKGGSFTQGPLKGGRRVPGVDKKGKGDAGKKKEAAEEEKKGGADEGENNEESATEQDSDNKEKDEK